VIEQARDDPQQGWAVQMDRLLRDLHTRVGDARAAGRDRLDPAELAGYRDSYQQIITLGHQTNPAGTVPTGKRGVIRRPRSTTCSPVSTPTVRTSCGPPTTSAYRSTTTSPSATSG
jgi:hypothetical protein